ncbi:MAG TPA: peptidylprolyl isomerase, partial [Chromatiaceae bacterium]|nr:peptidylprolyl isomerase [Chromatiaceae bacterium]
MRLPTELKVSIAALAAILTIPAGVTAAETTPPNPAVATPAATVTAPAAAPTASEVVATVNGVAISRAEVEQAARMLLAQSRTPAPTDPEQQRKVQDAALNLLIDQELLYQAAKGLTVADLDKQVEEKFNAAQARFGTPEAFEQALGQAGLTGQEFKDRLARDLLIASYIDQEVTAKITLAPEQAKQFYDANPDKFTQPESVKASHILIGADAKATPEEKHAAQQKANDILAKIKCGADFAELAKAESTCPSAKKGGDLGSFGRGQMVKPFEEVAFSLQDGAVSEVVETPFGYHI